ncbi:MAG: V-type ATP synthase subunit I, partial [Clostridia bacterium]|nr:V-type ATP synthase subunit I [Clostridia bacterium]
GLLLTLGCFGGVLLLKPRVGLRRMMLMFGYCGIASIIMGVIFGGWFGDLPTAIMTNMLGLSVNTGVGHFFGSGLWFNPLDDPMTFLILSLGVGAFHLIFGMAIKFVVLCKNGKQAEALCTILPHWVLFLGLIMLVLGMVGDAFSIVSEIGKYVAIVGVVMILLFNGYGRKGIFSRIMGGLGGLYGLINYASDLLSYSRILALGLVAGVIAKVINLITMLGATGAVGFVFMILILLVGHGLNLAINVLGTFVHTSRLQYIEFFGKFYEDGGKPFEPAAVADRYTEIQ